MDTKQDNTSHHFYAFIRHGERSDNVDAQDKDLVVPSKQINENDPPLTLRGYDQARKTGQFLKKYF